MRFKQSIQSLKDFCIRYPAVLSGYILYSCLFITTIDFFLDVKDPTRGLHPFDLVKQFDSLLWMWLLALSLVKIIEFRTRLHEQEKAELRRQQELQVQKTQLTTLLEVIRGLQHEINNPLTIVMVYLQKMERMSITNELRQTIATVRVGTQRIASILRRYSEAQSYSTTATPVGAIATPPERFSIATEVESR